ncbi:MAG: VWA domain-containing protein, partial [bacterium]|nr:VWA domain-containing protein [bacterium]
SQIDVVTPPAGCAQGSCEYVDSNPGDITSYRYYVQADSGSEVSPDSDICRKPLNSLSPQGNFIVFYRLEDCPPVEADQVCTQDLNVFLFNKHAIQMLDVFERYRLEYMGFGFNDPAVFNGGKPFPLDLFPCDGGGCAGGNGIAIAPGALEAPDYDPATGNGNQFEIRVPGHELFHAAQGRHGNLNDPFYKWVIEGQARATEDTCIFPSQTQCDIWDNSNTFEWQVGIFLNRTEVGLQEQSYGAVLFWVYIMEQFGINLNEPERGIDALVDFWVQNEENGGSKDGIETLNDALASKIGTSRRFKDIFQDFAVANYAKDFISTPVPVSMKQYNYIDEETYPGGTYGMVERTRSEGLELGQAVFGTSSADAWGARYFQVFPDAAVPAINIEVATLPATQNELYFYVLGIKNGNIEYQHDYSGTSFSHTVPNAGYDQIGLVVAAMGAEANFEYGFNLADGLYILFPTNQFPARVGEAASPKKFMLQFEVLDKDLAPVAGVDPADLTITVGNMVISPPASPQDDPIIAWSYIAGQYWVALLAPAFPGCDPCDLTIDYAGYSDTKSDAIDYGPVPSIDNMIVIDRSSSMAGTKIEAAKDAGKLYVDSFNTGDRIGVIPYNQAPMPLFPLTLWDANSRLTAHAALDLMGLPAGKTATGAALREGMAQLVDQISPNPDWAIVLLSDGRDTVDEANDHIPAFISEYTTRRDAGDPVPIIHIVAVGDDADGVELEKIVNESGGRFQWLSDTGVSASSSASTMLAAADEFPTELATIYRVFAEAMTKEQQIFAENVEIGITTKTISVDNAASEAVFVLKWFPPTVNAPLHSLIQPDQMEVLPTLTADGHLLWRVPAPQAGEWKLNVTNRCGYAGCQILAEAALLSDLTLEAFLGLAPEDRLAGRPMPLLILLSDIDPIIGAAVQATVPRTGETLTLFDDGLHDDGAPDDGFYGGLIKNIDQGGGYGVIVEADGTSPFAGLFVRKARISFFMLEDQDSDRDRLPDWWEVEHGTDPDVPDYSDDPDNDNLINVHEYFNKTDPLDPDTDDGGEMDGSEVLRGSDPLFPEDDNAIRPSLKAWAGVGKVYLRLSMPLARGEEGIVDIYRASAPEGPYGLLAENVELINHTGEWIDREAPDDEILCYRAVGVKSFPGAPINIESVPSEPSCATPGSDPYAPYGAVSLDPMTPVPTPPQVILKLSASDDPTNVEPAPFNGALLDADAKISGVADMLVSNRPDFEDALWEPYKQSKAWTADPSPAGIATVYVKFRDGAGNVSEITAISFMSSLTACPADFTGDGNVDKDDLLIFAPDFGRTDCKTGVFCEGDFDEDGDVDGSDFSAFSTDFGNIDCFPVP